MKAVIAERPAQPYVAIRAQVTMQTMDSILPPLMPQVFAWLGERGIPPAGPPFWKYNVIDMDRLYETDPADEPDMSKWTTQLAFRLSG